MMRRTWVFVPYQAAAGFTLIELAIVIAILVLGVFLFNYPGIEIVKEIIIGIVCGGIVISGIVWQLAIYSKAADGDASTLILPGVVGLVVVGFMAFGAIAYGIFGWIDDRVEIDSGRLFWVTLSVLGLIIAFFLKNLVGVLLLCSTIAWTAWSFLMHGEWAFIPIFGLVFSLVANLLPGWVENVYIIVTLGMAIVTSLISLSDM